MGFEFFFRFYWAMWSIFFFCKSLIFIWIESTGDCVVAINTRHIALRNDTWRAEAFHVRREYAKTRYDIPLFKLHELDPTKVNQFNLIYLYIHFSKVLHLCVLNCIPSDNTRRYDMARLYTFPDDVRIYFKV
jgi:hypothetical protein